MNKSTLKDYLASRVIMMNKSVPNYGKVYYKNNEKIIDDILGLDFNNKNVLSVLASSDYVFTFKALDAKKVDAFDYNKLTIYYYYLRKWSIKYMNCLYPKILDNNKWLKELLNKVETTSESEKESLEFFKNHLKDNSEFMNLFYDIDKEPEGDTIFSSAKQIKPYIDEDLTFYNIDLFNKNKNITSKYDIIYISNILEWARRDIKKLEIAYENLNNLLNSNGTIICTNLVYRNSSVLEEEKRIFSSSFERKDFSDKRGYMYIKK